MPTKIYAVVHQNGETATAGSIWGRPSATLFEITEGEHQGKRAPDTVLYDLVGQLDWDRSTVVIYETGEKRAADEGE